MARLRFFLRLRLLAPRRRAKNTLHYNIARSAVAVEFNFFCGDERYVALTLIGDLVKRKFAEKHHII